MTDKLFAKGVNVRVQETQFGEIIKVGIKKDDFLTNPFKDTGWINIDIKKGKSGKMYAEVNTYQKGSQEQNSADDLEVGFDDVEFDDEEIPF